MNLAEKLKAKVKVAQDKLDKAKQLKEAADKDRALTLLEEVKVNIIERLDFAASNNTTSYHLKCSNIDRLVHDHAMSELITWLIEEGLVVIRNSDHLIISW